MRILRKLPSTTLVAVMFASFLFEGCATDIVGKAEQTTHIAAINFDNFLQFELDNRAQLLELNPAIHDLAQKIRHKECATCDPNGIRWLKSARTFTEAYRQNRTVDNKVNMQTAIALIQTTLDQITQYFLTAQNKGITAKKK